MKVCTKCGDEKGLDEFYKSKYGKDKRISRCKQCICYHNRAYKTDPVNKVRITAHREHRRMMGLKEHKDTPESNKRKSDKNKAENLEFPEKYKARNRVAYFIYRGRLTRQPCEKCGSTKNIQAHHWSYLEEHWTDVTWLCSSCHCLEHKKQEAANENS